VVVRAEHLREDDLLTRYLEASRRYATPTRLQTNDLMLARYLKALDRIAWPAGDGSAGNGLRTCTGCGRHLQFDQSSGGWSECPACGALA